MRFLAMFMILLACPLRPAVADSWPPPTVQTTYSANKLYRFIDKPRDIQSSLAYFEAKAAGRDLPPLPPAQGRLEKFVGAKWELIWTNDLANEVAPVGVVVSDDGSRVITFDNWHSVGFGENVVVIYGSDGKLVRSLQLEQILPPYFIDALPRSVSSRMWRFELPTLEGGRLKIAISDVPRDAETAAFHVYIALEDGAVEPLSAAILATVKPRFCAEHIDVVRWENEWLKYERDDLTPWQVGAKEGWESYRYQVISRLGNRPPGYIAGSDIDFDLPLDGENLDKWLLKVFRDGLRASWTEMPVRWFSSRDLDSLTAEVERTAKKLKPDQLRGVELRFMTTKAHQPRIEAALAKSGARVFIADITMTIPQRSERLAELPADRAIDPACLAFVK